MPTVDAKKYCLVALLQDSVSQTGKLLWLYKRCGQRVIVNDRGDLIVRPSSLETRLEQIGSKSSHLIDAGFV